ncbi:uncharacterized protein BJ171DRAFT_39373 [Polychytrium aggregatum]|uniref:uncharacterized protein n=1 Tax=Polychytrium aggregatum TaxID=110093 RepID=UPI0022FDEF37|nr:uncharacterized protein BJ171DRAFT_39373 [Polychytrium aggregatum]KAI9206008.1 hypothetical protein BJ171DRAFT_39373 [Polychytrium aggregatum]
MDESIAESIAVSSVQSRGRVSEVSYSSAFEDPSPLAASPGAEAFGFSAYSHALPRLSDQDSAEDITSIQHEYASDFESLSLLQEVDGFQAQAQGEGGEQRPESLPDWNGYSSDFDDITDLAAVNHAEHRTASGSSVGSLDKYPSDFDDYLPGQQQRSDPWLVNVREWDDPAWDLARGGADPSYAQSQYELQDIWEAAAQCRTPLEARAEPSVSAEHSLAWLLEPSDGDDDWLERVEFREWAEAIKRRERQERKQQKQSGSHANRADPPSRKSNSDDLQERLEMQRINLERFYMATVDKLHRSDDKAQPHSHPSAIEQQAKDHVAGQPSDS